jgi:hypothetical protein
MALTFARCQREHFLTPNRGKAELSGWGPRSAVLLPDGFSHMGKSAFGATAHDDVHDAFMTLPPYTRTSEDEVHSLGLGVSNCSHRALSDKGSEKSESIEWACEATAAERTARCASVGLSLMSLSSRRWLLFGKGVIRSGWQPAVVIPERRNSIWRSNLPWRHLQV